jgi:chromosome segregation ATPase
MKEMVDATNEAGSCKNEVRVLRDKLKKAQAEAAQMEAAVQLKEQEVADQRNEQYQLLHKNKVDSLRHAEGLQTQINALNKEKQGLEG